MMNITIIGLGVIGGSLGMALQAKGHCVTGVDLDQQTLRVARETGAISRGMTDPHLAVARAAVVVLAVPVTSIIRIGMEIKPFVSPGAVITDVGSTKEEIVTSLNRAFPHHFVGGHPMTGSELAGIGGADQFLFENALYALTPTAGTDPAVVAVVTGLARQVGAHVLTLKPQEHDLIAATVSHLPHLLATVLMGYAVTVSESHAETLTLAAGGFRDLTRVASGDPAMWRDIYHSNRSNILVACRQFREILKGVEKTLSNQDYDSLVSMMQGARLSRTHIPLRLRGSLPAVYEVVATVPDCPGAIARLTGVLGEGAINIVDIEILRIREGDGGTIKLAFKTEEETQAAYCLLREHNIVVKRR
jgi:prephenate dehydrogenase